MAHLDLERGIPRPMDQGVQVQGGLLFGTSSPAASAPAQSGLGSQGYSGPWAVRVPRDPRTEWNAVHVWFLLKVNVSCLVDRIHFQCCVCFGCTAT